MSIHTYIHLGEKMAISSIISKFLIFIVLMAAGYLFSRTGYVKKDFSQDASKLVINFFMSFTIINSVISIQQEISTRELWHAMLLLSLSICMCYLIAIIAAKLVRPAGEHEAIFEMLLASPNILFIALPILDQLFGPTAVFYCSLSGIPYNILLYSYGVARISSGSSNSGKLIKSIFSMPLISTLIALLIFLFRLPIPTFIGGFISTVSAVTMPLSMVVIGSSLGTVSFAVAFKNRQLYLMSFLRLIITPLLVWLLIGVLTNDPSVLMTAVVIAAAPSGITVSVLAIQYGKDYVYSAEGVLLSTVLSMITTPVLLYFIGL